MTYSDSFIDGYISGLSDLDYKGYVLESEQINDKSIDKSIFNGKELDNLHYVNQIKNSKIKTGIVKIYVKLRTAVDAIILKITSLLDKLPMFIKRILRMRPDMKSYGEMIVLERESKFLNNQFKRMINVQKRFNRQDLKRKANSYLTHQKKMELDPNNKELQDLCKTARDELEKSIISVEKTKATMEKVKEISKTTSTMINMSRDLNNMNRF